MIVVVVISLYLGLLLLGSFRKPVQSESKDSFLLAGRKLTLLPFVATMVTTTYGWILGIGQLYYAYGISAWFFLSLPYTMFSLIMAFLFAARIKKEELHSVPELLRKHYGKRVSLLGSIAVLLLVSPAMYVLMAGQLLAGIFLIPLWVCLLLALFFSSVYLYRGGFATLAKMDLWKFLFMFLGFALTALFLFVTKGSEPLLALPKEKISLDLGLHAWEIATWFLLATVVFADPAYHQRIYAAHTIKTARRGLIISVFCWTVFDFLAATVALYAFGFFPELENPALAYPMLAEQILPPWLASLFLLGLLATVMSTLDSFLFLSAQTLMIDLVGQKGKTEKNMRWGMLLISLITFLLLLPYLKKNAVEFFFDFTPFIVCILVPPVVSIFLPKIRILPAQVFAQMLISLLIIVLWTFYALQNGIKLSAVVPGLSAAIIIQALFLISNKTKARYRN